MYHTAIKNKQSKKYDSSKMFFSYSYISFIITQDLIKNEKNQKMWNHPDTKHLFLHDTNSIYNVYMWKAPLGGEPCVTGAIITMMSIRYSHFAQPNTKSYTATHRRMIGDDLFRHMEMQSITFTFPRHATATLNLKRCVLNPPVPMPSSSVPLRGAK